MTTALITSLAREQFQLEEKIAKAEVTLKELKEQHKKVSEIDLPSAMEEADLLTFKLKNGYSISITDDLYCGIAKANEAEAFAWLRKEGHGALIKRDITVKFGKGEDVLAKAFLKLVQKEFKGKQVPITDKTSVHYQTLKAFIKECMANGTAIPFEPFGVTTFKRATITQPQQKGSQEQS